MPLPQGFTLDERPKPPAGFTIDAPPAQPQSQGGLVDMALAPGVGALKAAGGAPGLPVDAFSLLGQGLNWLTNREWRPGMNPAESGMTGGDWLRAAQRPVGPESEMVTPMASILRPAEIGARWAMGKGGLGFPAITGQEAASEPERVLQKAGGLIAMGGPAGAGAGVTATGTSEIGRALDKAGVTGGYGETAGLLAGPLVHEGVKAGARGLIPRVERDVAEHAQTLQKHGVDVAPYQIATNKAIGYPRSAADQLSLFSSSKNLRQDDDFVRAVAKTIGEDTTRITQKVWDGAQSRIGGKLEQIYKSGVVDADVSPSLIPRLADIEAKASNALQDAQFGYVRKALDETLKAVSQGKPLKGEDAWNLIKYNSQSALNNALNSSDDVVAGYALGIKRALMDALEETAPAKFKPDLAKFNKQYQNLITVGPVSIPNGGKVSPQALATRVYHSQGGLRGELGELAEAAKVALKPLPDSGTAGRLAAMSTIMAPSAAMVGGAPALPALGAWALGTGVVAPGVRGLLDSKTLARAMINKALPQAQPGLLGALGGAGQSLARTAPGAVGLLGRQNNLSPQYFHTGLLSP